jgi:tetratricopeptide (TPR) repeat protein
MQQSIGEIVRQVRLLRRLTQRELAGDRYSKSYVSAVEHGRIVPSAEALRLFAERLGQPDGNFVALLQQPDVEKALSVLDTTLTFTNGHIKRDATNALLLTLLEQEDLPGVSPSLHLPALAPDALAALPPSLQARYYSLMGSAAKAQGDVAAALRAFEAALALAPIDRQAAILDEIGTCHAQQRAYHTALGYHLHALRLLARGPASQASALLHLLVELHCGDDYLAVGAYRQALGHYESARSHLSAHHDLATIGKLYVGLGYLLYTVLFLATAPSAPASLSLLPEQIEHDYERASHFLRQGLSFYQASGDRLGEAHARLTLATLLLDWSLWQRRTRYGLADTGERRPSKALPTPLLDEAAEQYRQVLLAWQDPDQSDEVPLSELDALLYTALAGLVRMAVQRAIRARLGDNSVDVAYRERALAAQLCRLILETLSISSPPWAIISQALTLTADALEYRSPSLLRFTDLPDLLTAQGDTPPHRPLGLIEVYTAVGEVAEELGRVAAVPAFAHDCYAQANQYQQAALSLAYQLHVKGERDPGYLARLYQRWITLLEERAIASPALSEETTRALLRVLQQGFWHLQRSFPEEISAHGGGDAN